MAGITLETAQKQLDLWIAAEEKVTHGQSYQIGNRSLTYANCASIAIYEAWRQLGFKGGA